MLIQFDCRRQNDAFPALEVGETVILLVHDSDVIVGARATTQLLDRLQRAVREGALVPRGEMPTAGDLLQEIQRHLLALRGTTAAAALLFLLL